MKKLIKNTLINFPVTATLVNLYRRFKHRKLISEDINLIGTETRSQKKALVVYQHPIEFNDDYQGGHTNKLDAFMFVKILNELGFIVDFVDRSLVKAIKNKQYDLLLYNVSGGSGRGLNIVSSKLGKIETRIALFTSTHFEIRRAQVLARYKNFEIRNESTLDEHRVPDIDTGERFKFFHSALAMGHKFSLSYTSYLNLDVPVLDYLPPIPQNLFDNSAALNSGNTRSSKTFVCLSGGGFISKGIDVLIEAFMQRPDCTLYVFMDIETNKQGFDFYEDAILKSNNIKLMGKHRVNEHTFLDIVSQATFAISHSASEALSTSMLVNIISGLIPVTNKAIGIPIDELGVHIKDDEEPVQAVLAAIDDALKLSAKELKLLTLRCQEYSANFQQDTVHEHIKSQLTKLI